MHLSTHRKLTGRIARLRAGAALLLALLLCPIAPAAAAEVSVLGGWTPAALEQLQQQATRLADPGERIAFISAAFLDTPYIADTLIGSAETPEQMVLRLDGVDCFTLLDYVEALRRSSDFAGFREALRHIRYRDGRVDFLQRNHFFSDWGAANAEGLEEVTAEIAGAGQVRRIEKQLNRKADGSSYLPNYPVTTRMLAYIPASAIDKALLGGLRSGDYVGIYSAASGLDVSHCGILVRREGKLFLRHAASRPAQRRVMDVELLAYLEGKKGLVVYRPRALPRGD